LRNRGFTTASCNYSAVRLVLQLPQLPASCETRRRFCNWASCGLVAVAQGDFATEIATAVAAQLQMSDEWITGAQISAQSPSSVYRIVYSVIKSPVALVACCVVSDCRSTHRSVIHNRASFVCHKSSWIMSGAGYLFICCSCSCSCLPGHSTQGTKHRHMRLNTAKR
jgi:hypothetical protein